MSSWYRRLSSLRFERLEPVSFQGCTQQRMKRRPERPPFFGARNISSGSDAMHRMGASAIDAGDLPVGPFSANSPTAICPPPAQENFCFSEMQIRCISSPFPYPAGGALRIVTTLGAGGNGRERCRRRSASIRGRLRRVVLTPRRWCQVSRRQLRGRRWQKSPVTGESTL
jgi:hypothetical protein